jgi:hypothetical protein
MIAPDELQPENVFADETDNDASSEDTAEFKAAFEFLAYVERGRLASPVKVGHSTRWRVGDVPAALNAGGRNVDRA